MAVNMVSFIFATFITFTTSELLLPMLAFIFVFGIFRLTYFLLVGGDFND